jgi:type II secretory pathway pseudopilin PulG
MPDRSLRAFSLVELLIVIAVVLLLVGISMSGLQAARESARRLCCAANLRDLGLGLQHHHQALGVLPPSWGGPDSTATSMWGSPPERKPYPGPGVGGASGFVMLLPYTGELALAAAIDSAGWPMTLEPIYTAARIPALLCPSDPSPRSHNYLFSIGDRYRGFWPGFTVPPADNAGFQASIRGLFGLQSRVRLESVRDGLSHTIAMSECVIPRGLGRSVPQHGSDAGIRYSDGQSEAVTNDRFAVSFSHESPADCLARFHQGAFRPGTVLMVMNRSPGWLWSQGRPSYVSFSTVLPPNGPRCNHYLVAGSLTPQSRHPGGVLGLMADGAVRFIADDIDAGDPSLPDRQTGPSPYGVWGALGSRAGAEVTNLPLP